MVVQSFMSGGAAYPKLPAGAGAGLTSEPISLMPGGADVIPLDLSAVRVTAEGADAVTHEVSVEVAEARLAVTLHGPKTLYQNWPATYEAVIENQGEHPIRAATFEVKLPSGLVDNLRASDKPGYDAAGNRLVWKFDVLQPGEKKSVLWFGYAKQADDRHGDRRRDATEAGRVGDEEPRRGSEVGVRADCDGVARVDPFDASDGCSRADTPTTPPLVEGRSAAQPPGGEIPPGKEKTSLPVASQPTFPPRGEVEEPGVPHISPSARSPTSG